MPKSVLRAKDFMSEFNVSAEHLQKGEGQQRREVDEAKVSLAPWFEEVRDDFSRTRTKIVAMTELVFELYLNFHDEAAAFDLLHRSHGDGRWRRRCRWSSRTRSR
jgi:hypothetical protein